MTRTFISPGKYVQGPGEMNNLGRYASAYGRHALIIISEGGMRRSAAQIAQSFAGLETQYSFAAFNGECSRKEINRLLDIAQAGGYDLVIGIGGGKIFDTAKAVAYYLHTPVIICPTIAATDAPCSALSVIYTEAGTVEELLYYPSNPNMVIMDSEVIAQSPVRMTVSGMGDALATYFEARACYQHEANNCAHGKSLHTAMALAKLCYEMLLENGYKAKLALERHALTPAVEAIIEANTLLSGLGFESCGIAAAHAVHNGFCSLEECHKMYHGEKVAFGVITQLVLENASQAELDQVLDFCICVGLPVTLAQIGVTEPTSEKIMQAAAIACSESESIHNMPFAVNDEMVADAIWAADAIGQAALEKASAK